MEVKNIHLLAKSFAEKFNFFLPLERAVFCSDARLRYKELADSKPPSDHDFDLKGYIVGQWLSHGTDYVHKQYLEHCEMLEAGGHEFQKHLTNNAHLNSAVEKLTLKQGVARKPAIEYSPCANELPTISLETALQLAVAWAGRRVVVAEVLKSTVPSKPKRKEFEELLGAFSDYYSHSLSIANKSVFQELLERWIDQLPYPGKLEYKKLVLASLKENYLRFLPGIRTTKGNIHADIFKELLRVLNAPHSESHVRRVCNLSY